MPLLSSDEVELERVLEVAKAMCVAARTAPKAKGIDNVATAVVYGEELDKLAGEMEKLSNKKEWDFFLRDAGNIRRSMAVVLIANKGERSYRLNCGACGYRTCDEFEKAAKVEGAAFRGPTCTYDIVNLGIAIGSAVKIAGENGVDNRVMFSVGVAARKLKLIDGNLVIGIPLSATGKSIFFDRPRRRKT